MANLCRVYLLLLIGNTLNETDFKKFIDNENKAKRAVNTKSEVFRIPGWPKNCKSGWEIFNAIK